MANSNNNSASPEAHDSDALVEPSPSSRSLHRFKVVLLGESGVGKTSLVVRFVKDQFSEQFESTIGSAFFAPTIWVGEREGAVKLEIWDTAGQERYRSLAPLYYRNAYAAIVVYDLTDAGSFAKVKGWVHELRSQHASHAVIIALVGNKGDLADEARQVQWKEAQTYAAENELIFIETSAKTSLNVGELFLAVARKLATVQVEHRNPERNRRVTVNLREKMESVRGCCQ